MTITRRNSQFETKQYEMGKRKRPEIKAPAVGEDLRDTLSRALKSGQPIRGGITPLLYTEEDDRNARLATDIRTDRMQVAEAMIDKWNNRNDAKKMQGAEKEAAEMAKGEGVSTKE